MWVGEERCGKGRRDVRREVTGAPSRVWGLDPPEGGAGLKRLSETPGISHAGALILR